MADLPATTPEKQFKHSWRDLSIDSSYCIPWFVFCQTVNRDSRLIDCVALAATAYTFHEQPVSEHGATLQRVMLLGPTLFPLAFAALGGRSLKNTALWSAERGSTVGVHLASSRSCRLVLICDRLSRTCMEAKALSVPSASP